MKKSVLFSTLALILMAAFSFTFSPQESQVEAFMKLGDIKGESVDAQHRAFTQIEAFSYDGEKAFLVFKSPDKSSTLISKAADEGKVIPRAVLAVRDKNTGAYLKYELKDVLVSGFIAKPATGQFENFTLTFGEIKILQLKETKSGKNLSKTFEESLEFLEKLLAM